MDLLRWCLFCLQKPVDNHEGGGRVFVAHPVSDAVQVDRRPYVVGYSGSGKAAFTSGRGPAGVSQGGRGAPDPRPSAEEAEEEEEEDAEMRWASQLYRTIDSEERCGCDFGACSSSSSSSANHDGRSLSTARSAAADHGDVDPLQQVRSAARDDGSPRGVVAHPPSAAPVDGVHGKKTDRRRRAVVRMYEVQPDTVRLVGRGASSEAGTGRDRGRERDRGIAVTVGAREKGRTYCKQEIKEEEEEEEKRGKRCGVAASAAVSCGTGSGSSKSAPAAHVTTPSSSSSSSSSSVSPSDGSASDDAGSCVESAPSSALSAHTPTPPPLPTAPMGNNSQGYLPTQMVQEPYWMQAPAAAAAAAEAAAAAAAASFPPPAQCGALTAAYGVPPPLQGQGCPAATFRPPASGYPGCRPGGEVVGIAPLAARVPYFYQRPEANSAPAPAAAQAYPRAPLQAWTSPWCPHYGCSRWPDSSSALPQHRPHYGGARAQNRRPNDLRFDGTSTYTITSEEDGGVLNHPYPYYYASNGYSTSPWDHQSNWYPPGLSYSNATYWPS